MTDDIDACEQVGEAVERSDLTDEELDDLLVLLEKLEDELDVYTDVGDLFSLGGIGYKRVIRAPTGVASIRKYLEWREGERERLAERTDGG